MQERTGPPYPRADIHEDVGSCRPRLLCYAQKRIDRAGQVRDAPRRELEIILRQLAEPKHLVEPFVAVHERHAEESRAERGGIVHPTLSTRANPVGTGAVLLFHSSSLSRLARSSAASASASEEGSAADGRLTRPLAISNVCQTWGLAASPRSCRTVLRREREPHRQEDRMHSVAAGGRHEVVIAGAGPTGMMLAAELALARVDVAIVERRESQELSGSRAGGLHSRTIEVLDQRGVAERFLAQGRTMQTAGFALISLDVSDFPTRHNYVLALPQEHVERILAAWVSDLAVPIYRGCEVTGFSQDDTGVDVALSDHGALRAKYLVGCDGGRSRVRKEAGINFPGWDPSVSYLIAEAELTEEPAWGARFGVKGINGIAKLDDGKRARIVLIEPDVVRGESPTLDELQAALKAVYGTDFGVRNVTWLSRFTDAARQAASYRAGRVLLAGDSAHIHSPAG